MSGVPVPWVRRSSWRSALRTSVLVGSFVIAMPMSLLLLPREPGIDERSEARIESRLVVEWMLVKGADTSLLGKTTVSELTNTVQPADEQLPLMLSEGAHFTHKDYRVWTTPNGGIAVEAPGSFFASRPTVVNFFNKEGEHTEERFVYWYEQVMQQVGG